MAKSARPVSFEAYIQSKQDAKEDRQNAALVGMPVDKFKVTRQAKVIDRQIVALNKTQAKRSK